MDRAARERRAATSRPSGGRGRSRADTRGGDSYAWIPTALGAEERRRHVVRVAVEIGHRPLDVGDLQPVEEAQYGVAPGRHDSRGVPRPDLGPVLVVDPIAFPVQLNCDAHCPRTHAPSWAAVACSGGRSVRPNPTSVRGRAQSKAVTWRSIRKTWPRCGQAR